MRDSLSLSVNKRALLQQFTSSSAIIGESIIGGSPRQSYQIFRDLFMLSFN